MKKILALVSMLFLLPISSFALTVMQDDQMSSITGQAGVSIATDIYLGLQVDTVAWGDSDGTDGTVGWVGISDLNADLFFGLRTDVGTGIAANDLEVLTIDVGTDATGALYNGASYVRIGLGTFELNGNMDMDFELGNANTLGQELGTLDITGMVVRGAKGSYVDITTMGRNSGVTLNMNVLIDEINIASTAWGDSDGVVHVYNNAAAAGAGYTGLANLDIDNLAITGMLGIDTVTLDYNSIVADVASGAWAPSTNPEIVLYKLSGLMAANPGDMSDTLVILTLGNADGIADAAGGDININVGTMSATSAIGSTTDLTAGAQMGQIYISNANITVDGLVAIAAH
ncbi:MAG: hypothetical protein L3J69_10855 [Desulfobacula sp.]|nr:hypothetical protein [Desulfobacula sp.]